MHLWWYTDRNAFHALQQHYTLPAHSHKDAWRRVKSDDPISKITDLNLAHATGQGTYQVTSVRWTQTDTTLQHTP